ncbi:cytidine deaminase [Dorea sp. OM02-2LB]|nr:cytidine deaminase [Dorea sp. OM02-2LB]
MTKEQVCEKLMEEAIHAREFSYSPYSKFKVGAALLAKNGRVYTGCNIENGAYMPSNCAERTAIFKAVSEGVREFERIAIVGGNEELIDCFPCGVCRQTMAEFCEPEFEILVGTGPDAYKIYTLADLLPKSFKL